MQLERNAAGVTAETLGTRNGKQKQNNKPPTDTAVAAF